MPTPTPSTSPPTNPTTPRGLWLVLGTYLALALAFGLAVPLFENPDEHTHYFMAQHLATTARLPVQPPDQDQRGPWEQQGSQPPLYYALAAPLVRLSAAALAAEDLWYNPQNTMGMPTLVGNENRFIHDPAVEGWPWRGHVLAVHLLRLLATLLGLATLLAVWYLARGVFPARPALALAATALVALNPQFLAVHAAVSNDPMVILLATTALALTLRLARGGDDWPSCLALALVAGLAPLAKLSGLAVTAFVVLTLTALAWRRRDLGWWLRSAGLVLLAAALLAGWWYLRNLALYGDPTGLSHMHPGGTRRAEALPGWLSRLPAELWGVWLSTWGLFGWFTILLPQWIYGVITALALAGLAGLGLAWRRRVGWLAWPVLAWLGLWGALVFASLLRWMAYTKGGQGRLLFPALALLGSALVAGWRALLPARYRDEALAAVTALTLAALALGSLVFVIGPAYARAPALAAESLPEDAVWWGETVFDGKLRLAASRGPRRVREGETFPLSLYWQALAPLSRDGLVALRIDQPLASGLEAGPVHLAYPGGGTTPPRLLVPGEQLYLDRRQVSAPELASPELSPAGAAAARSGGGTAGETGAVVPTGRAPGGRAPYRQPLLARLSVHLYDPQTGERWPASVGGASGEWSTGLVIEPRRRADPRDWLPEAALVARFENGVRLYHDTAGGWLAWEATAPIGEDLTAFLHLVDAGGERLAQFDRPPAGAGDFPSSTWQPGDFVFTPYPITPGETPPGAAGWRMGLYLPVAEGPRVPAYRPDGTHWPDDAVVLPLGGPGS